MRNTAMLDTSFLRFWKVFVSADFCPCITAPLHMGKGYGRPHSRRPQAKKQGIFHPYSYSFMHPRQGIKKRHRFVRPMAFPGRWPVCIQLYGHGAEALIDNRCTHISAFLGLSACQGSLNSSKIVVNEEVLTCLKCPWIQCFQGIIRFWLDFYQKSYHLGSEHSGNQSKIFLW